MCNYNNGEEVVLIREWTVTSNGTRTNERTKTAVDFENYYFVVVDSLRNNGANSIVSEVVVNVLKDIEFCPDNYLNEILEIIGNFSKDYKGELWESFQRKIKEEYWNRIEQDRHVKKTISVKDAIVLNW